MLVHWLTVELTYRAWGEELTTGAGVTLKQLQRKVSTQHRRWFCSRQLGQNYTLGGVVRISGKNPLTLLMHFLLKENVSSQQAGPRGTLASWHGRCAEEWWPFC